MLRKCAITVEGFGKVSGHAGRLFLEILNERGLDLHNDCGGNLKCGKCRIVFASAPPEPLPGDRRHLSPDLLAAGVRLACIHQVRGDCAISIPNPPLPELLDDL